MHALSPGQIMLNLSQMSVWIVQRTLSNIWKFEVVFYSNTDEQWHEKMQDVVSRDRTVNDGINNKSQTVLNFIGIALLSCSRQCICRRTKKSKKYRKSDEGTSQPSTWKERRATKTSH